MPWTRSSDYALKGIKPIYALCGIFALTACGPKPITVNAPPPPAEWMRCEPEPARPSLSPLTGIAGTYAKPEVDARDSAIARYILALRAAHFDCANNLAKVRQYHEAAK